jgi:hemoglobin/transferrin/lactoferrin receptor protein
MSIENSWEAAVFSGRLSYEVDPEGGLLAFGGVSQGFRAPNLSDLSRLDTARSNEVEVPAPGLEPERFITYEAGLKGSIGALSGQVSAFRTEMSHLIARVPTGETTEDGAVVTKTNGSDGSIYGVEVETAWLLTESLAARTLLSWVEGTTTNYESSYEERQEEPASRMMPPRGDVSLIWDPVDSGLWLEGGVTVAGKQDRLSRRDKLDTQRIPPGGTPGYTVFSVRGGWTVKPSFDITCALENITNEDYRIHGSGLNEAGRNLVITLQRSF